MRDVYNVTLLLSSFVFLSPLFYIFVCFSPPFVFIVFVRISHLLFLSCFFFFPYFLDRRDNREQRGRARGQSEEMANLSAENLLDPLRHIIPSARSAFFQKVWLVFLLRRRGEILFAVEYVWGCKLAALVT